MDILYNAYIFQVLYFQYSNNSILGKLVLTESAHWADSV